MVSITLRSEKRHDYPQRLVPQRLLLLLGAYPEHIRVGEQGVTARARHDPAVWFSTTKMCSVIADYLHCSSQG